MWNKLFKSKLQIFSQLEEKMNTEVAGLGFEEVLVDSQIYFSIVSNTDELIKQNLLQTPAKHPFVWSLEKSLQLFQTATHF